MIPGQENMSHESKHNQDQYPVKFRKEQLWLRANMIQAIRTFFIDHQYLEVETPSLIASPAPESHIDAIEAGNLYLQASPELLMKRLVAAGYNKIFQICRCFRKDERGRQHLPEFTMLEWYRAGIDYKALMEECEDLLFTVVKALGKEQKIHYQGQTIDLEKPWKRISVRQAFDRYSSITPEKALMEDCFDQIMVTMIEPHLGSTKPTFLYDYPASLGSLARLKPDENDLAERFELYMAGIELANGFSELVDPEEQEERFKKDREERTRSGKVNYPMPKKFLLALKDMSDTAGIALGIDRLIMILGNREFIDDVVCFTPDELQENSRP